VGGTGSVVVATSVPPTATQRDVEGQETPPSVVRNACLGGEVGGAVWSHADDGPVGSPDSQTSARVDAKQSDVNGHATFSSSPRVIWVDFQEVAPLAGVIDEMTLPTWSTATQRASDAQETRMSVSAPRPVSMLETVHALGPAVGFVELTTSPPLSTATHSDTEGHEMLRSAYG
jgi:hypothetical protein